MAFFLLGRSEDGGLSLLSDVAFESRQDALAELGRITADPTFDKWGDDVVLIDLDSGTPVLLVRPTEATAAPAAVATSEREVEPEPAAFAAMADEVATVSPADEEPEDVPSTGQDFAAQDEPEDEIADEPDTADSEDADTDTKDAPKEAVDEPDADTPADDEEGVEAGPDSMDALRAAIARTTEHMEASGIVAPESIGPAGESEEVVESDQHDAPPDIESESEEAPGFAADSAEAPESTLASDEPAAVLPPEPPAWPWATASDSENPAEDATDEPSASDSSFVLEGLEDPSIDDGGSLIAASIDDESLAANRAVILGAYGETPDADMAKPGEAESLQPANSTAADEPTTETDGVDETATDDSPEPEDESDFIVLDPTSDTAATPSLADGSEAATPAGADLDAIKPAGAAAATDSEESSGGDEVLALSAYVCNDCVYVDTCPNKDQRRPEDCGSFQWK